jgi:hypothetical protein
MRFFLIPVVVTGYLNLEILRVGMVVITNIMVGFLFFGVIEKTVLSLIERDTQMIWQLCV